MPSVTTGFGTTIVYSHHLPLELLARVNRLIKIGTPMMQFLRLFHERQQVQVSTLWSPCLSRDANASVLG